MEQDASSPAGEPTPPPVQIADAALVAGAAAASLDSPLPPQAPAREDPPPGPLPPGIPPLPQQAGPLGEGDSILVRQAALRRRAVRSAAGTAKASSIVTLVIGGPALLSGCIWPSWDGLLVAAGICVVGFVEYRGSRRMRRADPSAARFLGTNQLCFLGLIVLYSVVQMVTFSPERAKDAVLSPDARSMLGDLPELQKTVADIDRVTPLITYGFYGLVIFLSILCQGGLALYYFTRRRRLEEFNRETPAWLRRLFLEAEA